VSQKTRQLRDAKLLNEAQICLQFGYFEGALERASGLQLHPELGQSARFTAWIARVYLGEGHWKAALKMRDVIDEVKVLTGGQGFTEYLCLLKDSYPEAAAEGIKQILRVADAQHGVFVTWHPSGILRLAEFAFGILQDRRSAVLLISIALGFRRIFVSLGDVGRLARLLIALDAPICIWADWCSVLIQHMHFATNRASILQEVLEAPGHSVRWALAEDAASEGTLKSALAVGPCETWAFLQSLVPHLDAVGLAAIITDRFVPNNEPGKRGADAFWSEPIALRYRYFWYDMITSTEQDLVRNGDWAMFGLPTHDFSMALAQWWRALESVLKRSVVDLLSSTFAHQPQLADWDRESLSPKRKKEESVFLEKLAIPDRAAKTTLYDILLVLKKCESTNEGDAVGSRLRLEAANVLKRYSAQIGTLTKGSTLPI